MINIRIPSNNNHSIEEISVERNLIIVGANGSGKTRFGASIEQNNTHSKRISAQRYLQLSESVQKQDYQTASNQLRDSYRNQSVIQPQNDYQQVLVSLFAQESKRNEDYVNDSRLSEERIEIPQSTKEKVVSVWNSIFPHRPLKLEGDRVRAVSEGNEFSGTEMSDGEKVGLYLISQVLLVEQYGILIIDEPELHLHKALMVRLWNRLEEERTDCTFIYITHDLDFAVSKIASKTIWIKSYQNNNWNWELLEPNGVIPENLYLEVLGSRKPILFVEGEKGSLDIQVYQSIYSDFTVIPCGGCEKVIESVKGLRAHQRLHDKKIFGIIDKDFRPEGQLTALESNGIYHTKVNKIESIFLTPEVITMICNHLGKSDKIEEIKNKIKEIYVSKIDDIKFMLSKSHIYRKINESLGVLSGFSEYETWKASIVGDLDTELSLITLPSQTADLEKILEYYPYKGLVRQIQGIIDLSGEGYQNLILSFFASEKREQITRIFQAYLPNIS